VSITAGTASFNGTYRPSPGALASFNGKSPLGTWSLVVIDNVSNNKTGRLVSWSMTVTTGPETSTTTAGDGSYFFPGTVSTAYRVRILTPGNDLLTSPTTGSYSGNFGGAKTGLNFGLFSTVFNAAGPNDSYFLWLDPTKTYAEISIGGTPSNPAYQIPMASLPKLQFNMSGFNNRITIDFTNGAPIPTGGINIDGGGLADSQLVIVGAGLKFSMSDTQIALAGYTPVSYQNLASLTLSNMNIAYSGTFSTLSHLNLDSTNFVWS
jgi:hypothetical protein